MLEGLGHLTLRIMEDTWNSLLLKISKVISGKPWITLVIFFFGISCGKIVQRLRRRSIRYLPGPSAESWLVGNLPQLISPAEAAEFDCKWTQEHGAAFRIKGFMGLDILYLTDPKALYYILNNGGYAYPKPQQSRASTRLMVGEGLVYAHGEQHARQRKLMNPAFSSKAFPQFFETFRVHVYKMIDIWKQMIYQSNGNTCTIDVSSWVSRTLLDIIGQAGFNYDFGALNQARNPLAAAYQDLFLQTTYKRSRSVLIFQALWGYIPFWMVKLLQELPTKKQKRIHSYKQVAAKVAKDMIKAQTEQYIKGDKEGKDILSVLIRANLSEDPSVKISNHEIEAQLTTLMLAGHDTTASSVMWGLYELSRDQVCQNRIREEITQVRHRTSGRGGDDTLTMADLESMKYLNSFLKEVHRYHPVIRLIHREASRDDVIPLSQPIQIRNGSFISSIPISKGQRIVTSTSAYNRSTRIWGDDADTFKPERFLREPTEYDKTAVGVTSNILTFSSGIRSCIGWRFAIVEMQIIFMELLANFNFSPDPEHTDIVAAAGGIITPMLKSNPGKASLPLSVSAI